MTKTEVLNLIDKCRKEKLNEVYLNKYEDKIPEELFDCDWITKLTVNSCPQLDIKLIAKLKKLEQLTIRRYGIERIDQFEELLRPKELVLQRNSITDIPINLPKSIIR